jgi:hypothetical protein
MMTSQRELGAGLGSTLVVLHAGLLTVALSAAAFLIVVGIAGQRLGAPLYGELVEGKLYTWLSLIPGFILLSWLTVAPYRRFGARTNRRRLAIFHACEAAVAVVLVVVAVLLWQQIGR